MKKLISKFFDAIADRMAKRMVAELKSGLHITVTVRGDNYIGDVIRVTWADLEAIHDFYGWREP